MSLDIGIDVGGTKILAGVVDDTGAIIDRVRRDTPRTGGAEVTRALADVIVELTGRHQVSGIGLCSAGFVSADRRSILANPNIPNWNGARLADDLEALIGRKILLENDANAAAWGERQFGAGKGATELVMLTIGTGVGGGLITKGEIFHGARGSAGEFGHIRAVPEGHLCGCGMRGCYEQYASGTALLSMRARQSPPLRN